MGKVNSHNTGKVWEKNKHSKVSQIFWVKQKSIQFPKHGKSESHNTGKVWKKTNIPKLWVSQIFWVKQKSIQFPKYGKSEFT